MLEGANELRLMLCKEKRNPSTGAVGQSVVAACGAGAASCLPRQLTDRPVMQGRGATALHAGSAPRPTPYLGCHSTARGSALQIESTLRTGHEIV